MSFIESYKNNLVKFRLISKIPAFLIVIFMMLEIGNIFTNLQMNPAFLENNQNSVVLSLSFQFFIALMFGTRFVLLWFKKSKFVWLSQLVWVLNWLSIIYYYSVTQIFLAMNKGDCIDFIYHNTFLYASTGLTVILIFYLFFSPIKQIIMLSASYFDRK